LNPCSADFCSSSHPACETFNCDEVLGAFFTGFYQWGEAFGDSYHEAHQHYATPHTTTATSTASNGDDTGDDGGNDGGNNGGGNNGGNDGGDHHSSDPPKCDPRQAASCGPSWWSTFWRSLRSDLWQGVRGPDQDFSDCMNENVSMTTFGQLNPERLFNLTMNQAEALAAFVATARGGGFAFRNGVRPVSVGTQLLRWGTGALGLRGGIRMAAVTSGSAALQAMAGAGAATLGVAIGSAWNCR
jgi:hypothetical protein